MVSPVKPFDYYCKPQTSYPRKQDYITFYVYDKGECLYEGCLMTKVELIEKYPGAVIQEVLDVKSYTAHREQHGVETRKLDEEFKNDLFQEFAVTDNPKRFKCYSYAWEKGHAGGYSDVYNVFCDVVELIQD